MPEIYPQSPRSLLRDVLGSGLDVHGDLTTNFAEFGEMTVPFDTNICEYCGRDIDSSML